MAVSPKWRTALLTWPTSPNTRSIWPLVPCGRRDLSGRPGRTTCIAETLSVAEENLASLGDTLPELLCVVTDKGYRQAELIKEINVEYGITAYIPERHSELRRHWVATQRPAGSFMPTGDAPTAKKASGWGGSVSNLPNEALPYLCAAQRQSGQDDPARVRERHQAVLDPNRRLQLGADHAHHLRLWERRKGWRMSSNALFSCC